MTSGWREAVERHRRALARFAGAGVAIAVVGVTFAYVLPRIADYGAVWRIVAQLSWAEVGALVAATLVNLVTFAPPWMVLLPGLGFLRAFVLTQASTASTYIAPGGAAVGVAFSYAMLRTLGFGTAAIGLAAALTGLWNQFALLGFPVVSLALLTLEKERSPVLQTVASLALVGFVVAVAGFAAALATARMARSVGDLSSRLAGWALRLVRRGPPRWNGESFVQFRRRALDVLRRRWHVLTLATLAGQLSVFALFVVTLRVLGVHATQVNGVEAFSAWSLARLLGSLPLTPGGLGIVEVGLTGALVGFGGPHAKVVAAVLLYRFLTIVPTLVLGAIATVAWRRLKKPASST
jgi:putative heme transporter